MKESEIVPDEIVIAGSRYWDLADSLDALYDQKDPVKKEDIIQIFGSDELLLAPVSINLDKYCVKVTNLQLTPVGHVWMYQSPAICRYVEEHKCRYITVKITQVCKIARVLKAVPKVDIDLSDIERRSLSVDPHWASNLPEVKKSITEDSLDIGIDLLNDTLKVNNKWCPELKRRLKNVIDYLPQDLSATNYRKNYNVYWMMDKSDDPELKRQSEKFLYALIHRGSSCQMKWWMENWFSEFVREAEDRNLLALYEAAGYTLEKIEGLLNQAPDNLYYIYKSNKERFPKNLYYSALPEDVYYRLLTLITLRELILKKKGIATNPVKAGEGYNGKNYREELFHFIHPAIGDEDAYEIHDQVKRLVKHFKIQEICQYLKQLKMANKILLPSNPGDIYAELVRMGMPTSEGFSEKTFSRFYLA